MNQNRDGAMRHRITKGSVNYWPNRFEATPPAKVEDGAYEDIPTKIEGMKTRLRSKKFREHYNQAQLFYNSLAPHEKAHLTASLAFELDHCDDPWVYNKMSERLCDIDLELAQSVAELVGADEIPQKEGRPNHGKKAKGLSQADFMPETPTIETRRIAIIIADGYDAVAYNAMVGALKGAGALPYTIGPRRTAIYAAGEDKSNGAKGVKPDHHLEGMRSTMFDSVFIPGGKQSIETLSKNGRALHWVREAYGHLKAIGATGEAVDLVKLACELPGMEFSTSSEVTNSYGVVTAAKVQPESFKETLEMAKGAKDFIDNYTYEISQHKNWQRELDGLSVMVAY
jgi:catalase